MNQQTQSNNHSFTLDLVPGDHDLPRIQARMLHPLSRLIAQAVRRGLDRGTLTIIGNKVKLCGTIDPGETKPG